MNKIFASEPVITDGMVKAVEKALRNDFMVGGKAVEQFEKEFAEYIGVNHAVAVSSGTDALVIAQRAANMNWRVATTPMSFVATTESIVLSGNIPVFIDIDETKNMDVEKLKRREGYISGIMPVHLYGQPCDIINIMKLAEERRIPLIEDCAQAHGAMVNGKKAGSFGIAGCWSFYTTKNMTCGGNGGMITTDDEKVAEKSRLLREHGGGNDPAFVGYNSRMSTVQAAFAIEQLKNLDQWNKMRKTVAETYHKKLAKLNGKWIDFVAQRGGSVYHLFVINTKYRDELQVYLKEQNIYCGVHYPKPIHKMKPYEKYVENDVLFSAEEHAATCLSIPCHPLLNKDDVERVCCEICTFFENKQGDE